MITAILQARMGSSRLPGKILKPISGKPLIAHMIDRLSPSGKVNQFVVATTTNSEDDALAEWCAANNITCFRGSDWDVLDRFYQATLTLPVKPEHIVRICCDNPLHHFSVMDFVIEQYQKLGVDYCSNSNLEPEFLEDGFDTEVFSFASLENAWHQSTMLSEREHVTPFIKFSGQFSCAWRKSNASYHYKLSVDTEEDRKLAEQIFGSFQNPLLFGIDEVVELLTRHPEYLEINKESRINAGYEKSLREDREVR